MTNNRYEVYAQAPNNTGHENPVLCSLNILDPDSPVSVRGAIESIDPNGIRGWCVDTDDVRKPVRVSVNFLGVEICAIQASEPRADIQDLLGNPCTPGFSVQWAHCHIRPTDVDSLASQVDADPDAPGQVQLLVVDGQALLQSLPGVMTKITNLELFTLLLEKLEKRQRARLVANQQLERNRVLEHYTSLSTLQEASTDPDVKVIAFYLPQYHPTPENDAWWGPGFTEWTNVSNAKPLFPGHEQPRLPADLGFYDLRLPEVREKQAELAREYGIYGFCYYYYWFSGRRILDRPLEEVLQSGKPDFPFCICWANESWSRRWDGSEQELLIGQEHDLDIDSTLIDDLIPLFEDPRYIRIDGRPLLIVYRVSLLPDAPALFDRWREICIQRGVEPPHVCMAETFGLNDPHRYGCDSAVGFPPHKVVSPLLNAEVDGLPEDYSGNVYDYGAVVQNDIHGQEPAYTRFHTVMASWDNTARRGKAGNVFLNATPDLYEIWLQSVVEKTRRTRSPGERLVFVNAWNEWAEGTHLEPSRLHGRKYLEATRRALTDTTDWRQLLKLAELTGELSREALPTFLESIRKRFEALERSGEYLSEKLANKEILWGLSLPTKIQPHSAGMRPIFLDGKVVLDRVGAFPARGCVVHERSKAMTIYGWSVCPGFGLAEETLTYLTLTSRAQADDIWFVPVYYRKMRPDVVEHTGMPLEEALWSGLELTIKLDSLPRGSYWIGVDFPGSQAIHRAYSHIELILE